MKYALFLLPLLLTVGCGNPHQARTLTEWQGNHPYARQTATLDAGDGTIFHQFADNFPRITAGGTYSTEARWYMIQVGKDDAVVDMAWGAE